MFAVNFIDTTYSKYDTVQSLGKQTGNHANHCFYRQVKFAAVSSMYSGSGKINVKILCFATGLLGFLSITNLACNTLFSRIKEFNRITSNYTMLSESQKVAELEKQFKNGNPYIRAWAIKNLVNNSKADERIVVECIVKALRDIDDDLFKTAKKAGRDFVSKIQSKHMSLLLSDLIDNAPGFTKKIARRGDLESKRIKDINGKFVKSVRPGAHYFVRNPYSKKYSNIESKLQEILKDRTF